MQDEDTDLEIAPREVAAMLQQRADFLLVDCRRDDEWELTRIEGAKHVPMQELSVRMDELREHEAKPIVVYCRSGKRSLTVTLALRDAGFANVKSMAGGLHRWSDEVDASVPKY